MILALGLVDLTKFKVLNYLPALIAVSLCVFKQQGSPNRTATIHRKAIHRQPIKKRIIDAPPANRRLRTLRQPPLPFFLLLDNSSTMVVHLPLDGAMIVTARPSSWSAVQVLGLVRGNIVASKIGRDLVAGMKSIVGGEIVSYTQMTDEARQVAEDRMVTAAQNLGADAVVAMRFASDSIAEGRLRDSCVWHRSEVRANELFKK